MANRVKCPDCGYSNAPGVKVCRFCERPLHDALIGPEIDEQPDTVVRQEAPRRNPMEAIRSAPAPLVRTLLIADVRGYTAFTNERGVPAAARLADRFADLCKTIVSQHGGEVIELRGMKRSPSSWSLVLRSLPRSRSRAASDRKWPKTRVYRWGS